MITFCKKTLHTFHSFSYSKAESSRRCCRDIPSSACGLSLIAGDCRKPANVLDSAAVKPPPSSSATVVKKDLSGLGCLEDFGGVGPVDGLTSCTESLGFESSDQMEEMIDVTSRSRSMDRPSLRRRRERLRRIEDFEKLPPPLSSLNRNGQSSFFLKPVRKDGRLQLVEVRIDRPEIFRASRHDGRLRLQFIRSESEPQLEEEEEIQAQSHEEHKEEEERVLQWKIPLTSGDGFRRCHEMSNLHIPLWNHQCVTSR